MKTSSNIRKAFGAAAQLASSSRSGHQHVTVSKQHRTFISSAQPFNHHLHCPRITPPVSTLNSIRVQTQTRHLRVEPTSSSSSPSSSSTSPPFNNLTYYTFGTPNGLKPAIVLEELDLPYNAVSVDISQNTQKEPWYLEINPNGRIPALKDGNLRVFETGAIMLYLLDHYDPEKTLGFRHGTREYYEMLSWLMWQMGGLGPMQGQANHFSAMAGVYSAYAIRRYEDETKRLISVLESQLATSDYLVADKYTIADIASFSWVRGAPLLLDVTLDPWPGVKRWCERIEKREAVQRALKVPAGAGTKSTDELRELWRGKREEVRRKKATDDREG